MQPLTNSQKLLEEAFKTQWNRSYYVAFLRCFNLQMRVVVSCFHKNSQRYTPFFRLTIDALEGCDIICSKDEVPTPPLEQFSIESLTEVVGT